MTRPATSLLYIASVMVVFDLPTLLAITVFTSGLAGCWDAVIEHSAVDPKFVLVEEQARR